MVPSFFDNPEQSKHLDDTIDKVKRIEEQKLVADKIAEQIIKLTDSKGIEEDIFSEKDVDALTRKAEDLAALSNSNSQSDALVEIFSQSIKEAAQLKNKRKVTKKQKSSQFSSQNPSNYSNS